MNPLIRLPAILAITFFAMNLFTVHAQAAKISQKPFVSLCAADETIVFSCMIRQQKNASLCASKNASASEGYLVYRFGRIGKKPELIYPSNTDTNIRADKLFTYNSFNYPKGSGMQTAFSIGAYTYTLYSDAHTFGSSGPGVIVQKSGKRMIQADCDENAYAELYLAHELGLPAAENPAWPKRTGEHDNTPAFVDRPPGMEDED